MSKEALNSKETERKAPRSRFQPKIATGMRLEERDEQILQDLFLHRLMSRGQIERTYFSSTARCNARLRLLFDYQFVARHFPPYAPFGAQAIYSVGKAALPVVARRLGMDLNEVVRFYRRIQSPTFIEHTLAMVEIWIRFREVVESEPTLSLALWLAEMQCRHEWEIRIPGGKWHKETFKPDGFARIKLPDMELNFFLEADLGHTSATQFLKKLLTHQRYLESGLFEQVYGGTNFKTLVITTGERRLRNLLALVETQKSSLFWFTTFSELKSNILKSDLWHVPEQKELQTLLRVPKVIDASSRQV